MDINIINNQYYIMAECEKRSIYTNTGCLQAIIKKGFSQSQKKNPKKTQPFSYFHLPQEI